MGCVIARVEISFAGESRGAVQAAKQTANAVKDVKRTTAESAQANVARRVEERKSLEAMAAEYRKVAGAAKRGSEEQIAAAKLEQKALRDLSSQHDTHSRRLKEGNDNIGKFTRGALAGSGVMGRFGRSIAFASSTFLGAAGFVGVMKLSIGTASDLREQMNKTDVVFKSNAGAVKDWSKDSATAMGIARNEALAYAGTFGNLLVPMGLTRKASADMSTKLVELASDLASFNNANPEEALEALRSGLTGEVEPMRRFGVFLSQNRIQAEALADGIVKPAVQTNVLRQAQERYALAQDKVTRAIADHGPKSREAAAAQLELSKASDAVNKALAGHVPVLTAAQKAMATYRIIQKDTKDAQGDFARTSNGLANQQRILKAQLTDLSGELGTALLPTLNKYLPLLTGWITRNEKNGTFQRDFNKAVKTAGEVVKGVIPVVKQIVDIFKTFADHVGGTKNALLLLGGVMVGAKVLGPVLTLTKAVRDFRLALLGAQAAAGGGVGAAALGGGLRAALLALGDAGVITALAAGAAALAPLVAGFYGLSKQTASTAGKSFAGHDVRVQAPTKFTVSVSAHRSIMYDNGQWFNTEDGSKITPKEAAKLLGISVAELNKQIGLQNTANAGSTGGAAGGAGSEAAAKAAAGKGHGAPGASNAKGTTPSEIAVSASKQPGAGSTGFHLENERTPYDCSAFVQAVFRKAGIQIGSTTYTQIAAGRKVDVNDLQADDIVFFNYGNETWPGHVAIYVGGGMVVHDHGASGGVAHVSLASLAAGSNHKPEGRCYIATHVHASDNTGGTGGAGGTGTTFHEKPKPPTRLEVLDTAVSRAKALTPKNVKDDLRALRAERDYVKQRITEGHATKELYDTLASLNSEIDSITTGKKVGAVSGAGLLSAPTRIAIAKASGTRGTADDRSALVRAREELEKLQKTASKREKVPIAEELGRINKQIKAIDVATAKSKAEAIAKANENTARRIKAAIDKQKAAWEQHVQDLQQVAADAKSKFEDQWSKMADGTMQAFDKGTADGLKKMQTAYAATVKSFDKDTAAHLKQMAKDAAAALNAFDEETRRGLAALGAPDQTPTEKILADRAAKRQVDDDTKRVQDAQAALDKARGALGVGHDLIGNATTGTSSYSPALDPAMTPERIQQLQDEMVQAQKDLDDALYQQQTDSLQTQADAERKAADQKAQDDQDAYQKQRDTDRANLEESLQDDQDGYQRERDALSEQNDALEQIAEDGYQAIRDGQRQSLEAWLAFQESALEQGTTDWQTFFEQLIALSGTYGIDAGAAYQSAWIAASRGATNVSGAAAAAAEALGADPDVVANLAGDPALLRAYLNTLPHKPTPGFATGGWADGRPTSMDPRDTIAARLRPGEYVMSPEEVEAGRPRWGSGGDVHVHFHGDVYDTKRAAEDAVAKLAQPGLERRGPSIYMSR